MQHSSRRQFLVSAVAGASVLSLPMRRVLGANETINLGFIGTGSRGTFSAKWFSQVPDVRIAALCDADEAQMAACQKRHPQARMIKDLRTLLDQKDIDAVVISTCNHWHSLATVWACQAGKDVYVEKPISQTIREGRKIVEAARKYKRIVQGGTQQRSDALQENLREMIKSGKLGKMQWIHGLRFGLRQSIGKLPTPLKPPASVDYDLWLGPAQDLPMYRKEFHYDWHWFWNTGSGEMGNWAVHILDDIRNMLLDKCTLPKRVLAGGARVAWNDAGETPNAHFVFFDTGIVPVVFSLSNLPSKAGIRAEPHFRGVRSGFVIQFENGYYAGGRGGGATHDLKGKRIEQFDGDGGEAHARNFIDAIRRRDSSILNAEIEQTHYSTSWCHLANIAFRVGVPYTQEKALAIGRDFKPWTGALESFKANIAANNVDFDKAGVRVSPLLEVDVKKETITGGGAAEQARALVTREYRKGYAVPEKV